MLANLGFVYRYRELIRNLTLRDLKVRYRNSLFGFLWAWGNPLLMTGVFYLVFKVLLNSPIENFPLFILIGWLVWGFTTSAISDGIGSVVGNANLVKKVWFPRIALPTSAVLANAANFLLALPLVIALMFYFRVRVQPLEVLVYFPLIFISQLALVMGISYILSSLNVYYRDTAVITNVLLTAWFFLTPVFYPVSFLTGNSTTFDLGRLIYLFDAAATDTRITVDFGRLMYILNPMASVIESYRNILYGSINGGPPAPPDIGFLTRTLVTAFIILFLGYVLFARISHGFGEEL